MLAFDIYTYVYIHEFILSQSYGIATTISSLLFLFYFKEFLDVSCFTSKLTLPVSQYYIIFFQRGVVCFCEENTELDIIVHFSCVSNKCSNISNLCTSQFQNRPCSPTQTPRHLIFLKNFGQIPCYVASLDGQIPRGSNHLSKCTYSVIKQLATVWLFYSIHLLMKKSSSNE